MTRATKADNLDISKTSPIIAYTVAMPQPSYHIFEVKLQVSRWQESILELGMPVWTPGSYLVREYARHIQYFHASSSQDKTQLSSKKISKNHWLIETENINDITIDYQVYANELTVRTNHLDGTHGYFNGAALFYFIPGLEKQSISVQIIPPIAQWKVSTTLPEISGKINLFQANDYDNLVDSPF